MLIKKILIIIGLGLAVTACNQEKTVAPESREPGIPFKPIDSVRELPTGDPYVTPPENAPE